MTDVVDCLQAGIAIEPRRFRQYDTLPDSGECPKSPPLDYSLDLGKDLGCS